MDVALATSDYGKLDGGSGIRCGGRSGRETLLSGITVGDVIVASRDGGSKVWGFGVTRVKFGNGLVLCFMGSSGSDEKVGPVNEMMSFLCPSKNFKYSPSRIY